MRRFVKPRAVKAYGVSRRMRSGRNQPLLLLARDATGDLLPCVVKARPRLAAPPSEYLFEWLGSALARRLGLTVPDPLAVTITSEFASAASMPFRTELNGSVGLLFGSRFVRSVSQQGGGHRLLPSQREAAAHVLAFDVFIHNSDRRAANNNLFIVPNDVVWTVDQARGKLSRIVAVLRRRRDAVDDWLPKVFACLDR